LTITGGLLGIACGLGIGALLASLASWPVKISVASIIMAVGFSVAIGVGFGLWPAMQAAKLNPVDALRYE
ncbi:MAG: MacB family efflux pump subunit, partial [Candidatus Margulisiibacteriota bacterium]